MTEACQQKGLDPQVFLAQLEDYAATTDVPEINVAALSLTELTGHIERIHHAYLHEELPRLEKMVTKVGLAEKVPKAKCTE
ncbi:hypothetical protein [Nodosilinea sp. LEGE 07298]|uniref:hypothetical protein n=1 Tax=Nodosilinea sp. LEGE 07298 TaxID=2777970 RepID=UPI001D1461DB|nr:hypothetical protein [Nodosilinea sp. LEGE 07298]